MKFAARLLIALLAAASAAWPAASDPRSDELFVVGDLLLLPSSWEQRSAEFHQARLNVLPGTTIQLGDRNGGIGKAVIRTVEPPDEWDKHLVTLDRAPDTGSADYIVGFERPREMITPLAAVPNTPAVTAIVEAQVRSLGAKGTLVDATAWQHDTLLVLEMRSIIAGTKREDFNGNLATGVYILEWTGGDWLLKHALTGRNVDDATTRTLSVLAVAYSRTEHELTVVLRSIMYEWVSFDAYAISGLVFEPMASACDGIC